MKACRMMESERGFSLVELMVSAAVLLPLIGAVVVLFGRGVDYYTQEQRSAQMNQEARMAVEVMSLEIAQAGARKDFTTTTLAASGTGAQTVNVNSSDGFYVGDRVTFEPGTTEEETVQLTAVGTGNISATFTKTHVNDSTVSLFAVPYLTGIVPPAGMLPNSSVASTTLRFYGDFYDDGKLYYIVYTYDGANQRITKSITPLSQAGLNPAETLIRNVTGPASPFTLYSDNEGVVTSAQVSLTVKSEFKSSYLTKTGAKQQQDTAFAARLAAPSVQAASAIQTDNKKNGEVIKLPATPAKVTTWSGGS